MYGKQLNIRSSEANIFPIQKLWNFFRPPEPPCVLKSEKHLGGTFLKVSYISNLTVSELCNKNE